MMDNPRTLPIVSAGTSEICGKVYMNIVPCMEDGNEEIDDEGEDYDDPNNLVGNELNFKVKIDQITDLPENFCTNIHCEYEFHLDKKKYVTETITGKNQSPQINYNFQHCVPCVTKNLIEYLLNDKMTIKVYGNQDLKRDKKRSSLPQNAGKKSGLANRSRDSGSTKDSSLNVTSTSSESKTRAWAQANTANATKKEINDQEMLRKQQE